MQLTGLIEHDLTSEYDVDPDDVDVIVTETHT